MSITVPAFTNLPNPATQTESQYNAAWTDTHNTLNVYGAALNALGAQTEEYAARAEAAAEAVANTVWVSGTSYTVGQVRYSPVDFLSYRRKTNGGGTTDPSLDPTNWALLTKTSPGGADTTSSAVDITLTASSGRLQIINMTAPNKSVYAPAASTLTKGSSIFVVKNAGTYRFAYRASGGRFVCYIQPGQLVAFHASDVSTVPGIWHASGQDVDQIYSGNNAEVLNAVASNFIAVAMLTSTQAICAFKNGSTTYLAAVVLNYGSASGTPAQVINHDASYISIAAQTSTQVTIVYKKATGETQAIVLNISGNSFTPGTGKQIDATTGGIGTAVTALSSSQLLAVYQGASAGTPRMRVLDIVSSVVNESGEAVADSATSHGAFMRAEKVSANKALVAHRDNSGKKVQLRLESISGSTPAATGSVLNLANTLASTTQFGLAVMSASRAVVITNFGDRSIYDFMATLVDISGTSPVLLRSKVFNIGIGTTAQITATKLDANNIFVALTGGFSGGVDGATIKITGDDMILVGKVSENIEPGVGTTASYVGVAALDSGHVMQVCRNKDTYLSAKTLELAA